MRSNRSWIRGVAAVLALTTLAASCGSDDDGASVRDLGEQDGSVSASGSGSSSASSSASGSASAPASGSGSASGPGSGSPAAFGGDGGFDYASDVSAHRLVTDDVCDIKDLLGADPIDFDAVESAYRDGGHSVNADGSVRTLAGFATAEDRLHGLDAYYGSSAPLDDWIVEALDGTGRFADASDAVREQAIEKGAQNQILVAWAIHELRSALAKAADGDFDAASGAPHNWDEAWAFYHGASPDCAPYATADKRAGDFGTVGADGETAAANEAILAAMITGRDALVAGDADAAREAADEVVRNLVVTYSQATIRYASLVSADVADGDLEAAAVHRMEGLSFFRVIEATVAAEGADVDAVNAVYDLEADLGSTGDAADVRAALEPAWDSLGITDADLGTLDS